MTSFFSSRRLAPNRPYISAPALRRAPLLAAMIATAGLGGCGYYFGSEEDPLPGERISLRTVIEQESRPTNGVAQLPPTRVADGWAQNGGSAQRTLGHIAGAIGLNEIWSVSIGAGSDSESRITASPVVGSGRVFTLDAAATVSAFSAATGDRLWETEVTPEGEDGRDGFGGGLALSGGRLIVTTGFGQVHALNIETGAVEWTHQGSSPIRGAPAVSGGAIVFVGRDGVVAALNERDGSILWQALGVEGGASMLGGGAAAISGEIVAAPFATGDLSILRLRDGRVGWRETLGAARRGVGLSLIADISSPPVMQSGRIYAGGVSGRIVAFDVPTGRRIWVRDLGAYNPVWAAETALFVVTEDARLAALDPADGSSIWEAQLPLFEDPEDRTGAFAYGGPILVGGHLYLTSSDGKILRVDATSGESRGEAKLSDPSIIPPISAGGILYVLDDGGRLYAFQ